jgi:hypothetical protein
MSIPYPMKDSFDEYLNRAKYMLHQATLLKTDQTKTWAIMSAVYPLESAFELAREWPGRYDRKKREESALRFEEEAEAEIPYIVEVRTLRHIDFHRDPVRFHDSGESAIEFRWMGNVKLEVNQNIGAAMMTSNQFGVMEKSNFDAKSGRRQIIRPKETLNISKYRIFVDAEKAFVDVLQLLNCFGQALEKFVPEYFDRLESSKPEEPPIGPE